MGAATHSGQVARHATGRPEAAPRLERASGKRHIRLVDKRRVNGQAQARLDSRDLFFESGDQTFARD